MLMKKSVSARSTEISFINLPVSAVVLLVGANVPSARLVGLDSHNLGSILFRTFDVEVLLVVDVLESPTLVGLLNLPLHGEVMIHP